MKLLFATANAHKAEEVRAMLADSGIELTTLLDVPELGEAPETGDTFEHNAVEKAEFVYAQTGVACIADDSGIEVDALGGRPGVHSKRYSPEGTAAANNALLLRELDGIEHRTARFRCVLAYVGPDGVRTVEGRCEGRVALAPRGSDGFGYDPLFLPDEAPGRTMAELSMAAKNAISHRGRAFARLHEVLPKQD
jgi:XTP/dITP diphosphohydrolase